MAPACCANLWPPVRMARALYLCMRVCFQLGEICRTVGGMNSRGAFTAHLNEFADGVCLPCILAAHNQNGLPGHIQAAAACPPCHLADLPAAPPAFVVPHVVVPGRLYACFSCRALHSRECHVFDLSVAVAACELVP